MAKKVSTKTSQLDMYASRAKSIDVNAFMDLLPNPDPIIRKMGLTEQIYSELETDAHFSAVSLTRKAGVTSLLWEVDRGKAKSRQAKFIEEQMKSVDVARITSDFMNYFKHGYLPVEVMYGMENSMYTLADVVVKPAYWFSFDGNNQLRFKTKGNYMGELISVPRKIFHLSNNATYQNPYGESILAKCYWPISFKRGGQKYWVAFMEKFGQPFLVGMYEKSNGDMTADKLLEMLELAIGGGALSVPKGTDITALDTAKTASSDIYNAFIKHQNDEISKAVLGHSAAADSTPGKLGGEDTQLSIMSQISMQDRRVVEQAWNTVIRWLVDLNFGENVEAPKMSLYSEDDVDMNLANRDASLANNNGVRFTDTYIKKAYNLEDGDFTIVEPSQPQPFGLPEFAEFSEGKEANPGLADTEKTLPELGDKEQKQVRRFAQPIFDLLEKSESLVEFRDSLASIYPDLDNASIEKTIKNVLFVAETLGRIKASQGQV